MKNHNIFYLLSFVLFLYSCEEPYTPPTTEEAQQYVVEGYVEVGEGSLPTYVLLTKSIPYLSEIGPDKLASLFVQDATIVVNDGDKDVTLTKLCVDELPEEIRKQALELLGFNPDSTVLNICVFVDFLNQITKEEGRKYDLKVAIKEDNGEIVELTSTTTIPRHVPLYSPRFDDPPGEPNDTLAQLWVRINDPEGPDYYRFMTTTDTTNSLLSPFQSTTDDALFNGKEFEFPLNKAERRGGENEDTDEEDFDSFGLFTRGDSLTVKWMCLDKVHFDFWTTRDFAANSGGPFASYTRIKTNIKGGLGIWGGYSVSYYRLYCPPK